MGLSDTLKEQGVDVISSIGSSIGDFIKSQAPVQLVKIANPQQGNLTAAQIAAGQRGQAPATAAPQSGLAMLSNNAGMILPIVAVLALAVYLMKKR